MLKDGGLLIIEVPVRVRYPFSGNDEPLLPHTEKFDGHYREYGIGTFSAKVRDRKSTRLNSSHIPLSRMPSSA